MAINLDQISLDAFLVTESTEPASGTFEMLGAAFNIKPDSERLIPGSTKYYFCDLVQAEVLGDIGVAYEIAGALELVGFYAGETIFVAESHLGNNLGARMLYETAPKRNLPPSRFLTCHGKIALTKAWKVANKKDTFLPLP